MAQAIANAKKKNKGGGHPGGNKGGGNNSGGGNKGGGNNGGGNKGGGNKNDGGHGGGNPGYNLPDYLQSYLDRGEGDINKMASTQVDLALHPYLAEIDRSQQEAQQQYGSDVTRAKSIYGGLQNDLAPIQKQYSAAASDVQKNLSQALGQFANQLPEGGFGQENKAASGAVGASGAGALGLLAANEAQQAAYNASAGRQASIEQADVQHNFLSDLQDAMDVLRNRRLDVMEQAPEMTTARLDQLMQQQLEGNLGVQQFLLNAKTAKQSHQSDKALQDYLLKSIGASTKDNKGGGNGGGNGNKGGGKGGGKGGHGGDNKGSGHGKGHGGNGGQGGGQSRGGGSQGGSPGRGHSGSGRPGSGQGGKPTEGYATALGILLSLKNNSRDWSDVPDQQRKIALSYIRKFANSHPKAFGGTHPQASKQALLQLLLTGGHIGGGKPGGGGRHTPK